MSSEFVRATGRLATSVAAGLAVSFMAFGLGGCAADAPADELSTEGLALIEADAAVVFSAPTNNMKIPAVEGGNTVAAEIVVTGATLGAGADDAKVQWYLDGALVATNTSGSYAFLGVPPGQRHLAARLVDASGNDLGSAPTQDGVHVRIEDLCGEVAECDDGLACSTESCIGGGCRFGRYSQKLWMEGLKQAA